MKTPKPDTETIESYNLSRIALKILPIRKFVAILLIGQLAVLAAPAQVQSQPPAAGARPQAPLAPIPTIENLKILVLEGQGSVNNTSRHIGIQPVVEVRDENDRPVEGATVIFRLPPSGPGGTFPGNSPTFRTVTNAQGQATANGFVPGDLPGRFEIHATATYQNRTGEATISQTNSATSLSLLEPKTQKRSIFRNKYFYIGVGAAVGAGVAIALLHGHSGPKQVTITPGPVAISQ